MTWHTFPLSLEAVVSPTKLVALSITTSRPCPLLQSLLPRFTSLVKLELCGPSSVSSLFDELLLNPLPLQSLTLGDRSPVSFDNLRSLLDGPRKLPALRFLRLDIVWGEAGPPFEEGCEIVNGRIHGVSSAWKLPRWVEGMGTKPMEQVLGLAEETGVQISGTVLRAMEVDNLWDVEVMKLDKRQQARSLEQEQGRGEDTLDV